MRGRDTSPSSASQPGYTPAWVRRNRQRRAGQPLPPTPGPPPSADPPRPPTPPTPSPPGPPARRVRAGRGPTLARKLGVAALSMLVSALVGAGISQGWPAVMDRISPRPPVTFNDVRVSGPLGLSRASADVATARDTGTTDAAVAAWSAAHDVADVPTTSASFVLRGERNRPVVVRQIRARVLQRAPPLAGTFIKAAPAGGDEVIEVHVDLGEKDPVARNIEGADHLSAVPYFARHSVRLSKDEPASVTVVGHASGCTCTWQVEIDVLEDDRIRTLVVPTPGGPMRTSGYPARYAAVIEYDVTRESFASRPAAGYCPRNCRDLARRPGVP